MSTYMAKPETVQRSWYIIDAAGKPLGKTAVTAANILRGKHRPEFTPHVDCGECVIIINCAQAVLTGKKLDQKFYRTHSGYKMCIRDSGSTPPLPRLQVRSAAPRIPSGCTR